MATHVVSSGEHVDTFRRSSMCGNVLDDWSSQRDANLALPRFDSQHIEVLYTLGRSQRRAARRRCSVHAVHVNELY